MLNKILSFHEFMMTYHPLMEIFLIVFLIFVLVIPLLTAIVIWSMCNCPWLIAGITIGIFVLYLFYCILDFFKRWG